MKGAGIQLPVPKVSEVVDGKQEKAIDGMGRAHLYVVKLADGKSQIEELGLALTFRRVMSHGV